MIAARRPATRAGQTSLDSSRHFFVASNIMLSIVHDRRRWRFCELMRMTTTKGHSIGPASREAFAPSRRVFVDGTTRVAIERDPIPRYARRGEGAYLVDLDGRLIPPSARVVQIDLDPQEIGRNDEVVRLVGDAAETLDALAGALGNQDLARRTTARRRLEARIADAWCRFDAARAPLVRHNTSPLRPERVMAELQTLLTLETIVVAMRAIPQCGSSASCASLPRGFIAGI